MLQKLYICQSTGFDPYTNLAIEKRLLDTVLPGSCILYLWQNQNTVVIGSNQNAWAECRTSLLEAEGGNLARRLSGGGAVFHDLGNLNFTFLLHAADYDVDRQLSVIQEACALAGINAEKSGRNDLLVQGRKFSGNAFYKSKSRAYHHGTLLIHVDQDKLQRYLSPPKAKLQAKGVSSVRSRVVNLSELSPGLTCQAMKEYMQKAFSKVYALPAQPLTLCDDDWAAIQDIRQIYASWEHIYSTPMPFSFACEAHFPWGHVQLQLQAKNGTILDCRLYSDAMDWQLAPAVQQALIGCQFRLETMQAALRTAVRPAQISEDLCQMLAHQSL